MSAPRVSRLDRTFATLGVLGLVLGGVLTAAGMSQSGGSTLEFAQSYFYAFVFWASLTFGFFGLSLMHHAMRGHWGFPVLRIFEAGGGWRALLLVALAWIPVGLVWRKVLYSWSVPEIAAKDPIIQAKSAYLNDARWIGFSIFAFAVFIFWAYRNQMWQRKEDESGDEKWMHLRINWSAPGLVLFVLVMNFLYTDWVMSQDPHWFSTMFGVWFVVGSALSALALTCILIGSQAKKEPYAGVVKPWLTKDLGNLMLTFTMLWAYFSFSQYLIIWSGNLPETTPFFLRRVNNGWHLLGNFLIIGQFFVPFLALLAPRTKRVPALLAALGMWVFCVRFLDLQFIVVPTYREAMAFQPLDLGLLLVVGGVWCLQFGYSLSQAPLLTWRIPELKEAIDHA